MFPIRLNGRQSTPNGRQVLSGVDLTLAGEGITLVIGPKGAGKSVSLRILAGLERPHPGSIAMVFQHPMLLRTSVEDKAALGLKPFGLPRA